MIYTLGLPTAWTTLPIKIFFSLELKKKMTVTWLAKILTKKNSKYCFLKNLTININSPIKFPYTPFIKNFFYIISHVYQWAIVLKKKKWLYTKPTLKLFLIPTNEKEMYPLSKFFTKLVYHCYFKWYLLNFYWNVYNYHI